MSQLILADKCKDAYSELDLLLELLNKGHKLNYFCKCDYNISDLFDWNYFIRLARFHKVIPLVYQCIKLTNSIAIPCEVLTYLRQQSCRIALSNSIHTHELIKILDFCNHNQIPVIPFKGAMLAQLVYGDINQRQFCDLDICVKKKDFDKVLDLLVNTGYISPYLRKSWKSSISMRCIISFHCAIMAYEIPFGRKQQSNKCFIDLHNRISRFCNLNFDELYQRLQSLDILNRSVGALTVEDTLIIVCLHGSQDGWNKLQSICDIAYLIQGYPELDWDAVVQNSRKAHCVRRLLIGLALADNFFVICLPKKISEIISQETVLTGLVNSIIKNLSYKLTIKKSWKTKIQVFKLKIMMLEQFLDRVEFCLNFVWFYLLAKFHRKTSPDHVVLIN